MKGFYKRKKKLQPKTDLEDSAGRLGTNGQEHPAPAGHHSSKEESHHADDGNSEFRDSAKIWALYLKEASDRAKTQTELWKTGLESLLLFAGLFAGVVSAFLLESRKKLRLEDQELLLRSILNVQQGLPLPKDDYQPTVDQLWINGLWFSSLLITLFSAIVGVLAKSWLVKYSPLAKSEESGDAYQRWTADESVKTWRMERVFTFIPLFVQLSFFLFAVGFAIQSFNDNQVLGYIVSVIVGLGIVVYLTVTALPFFIRDGSCPFQTPLSELLLHLGHFILWLCSRARGTHRPSTPGINIGERHSVLTKIWCQYLIRSPKHDHLDEAVAEVARTPLGNSLLESFAAVDTPRISLKRLDSCMSSSYQADPRRNEIISNHLLALSRFIDYSERQGHESLRLSLEGSLAKGNPLGRWNFFTEPILPLAFSVRIPLLLAFKKDISAIEVTEQPWDQLARNLQPQDRVRFFLASCRALVAGGANLRKVSSLSLASCMAIAIKSGFKTEWSGVSQTDQELASKLVRSCIIRLFNEIIIAWKGDALEYWETYSSIGNIHDASHEIQSSGFPRSLGVAVRHHKAKYRHQAVHIIEWIAYIGNASTPSQKFFQDVLDMALFDKDMDVRKTAKQALDRLTPEVLNGSPISTDLSCLNH
ncbi:hypothetical protein BKA70DRAFT_735862 [Coprinopsis sp. MPI-PUGE-AT-0042]|nr:hypothetical protein BKA70DRAFT_735862 [Coprinopsis sp. MPI-PUGE-AT-0042]